MSGFARDDDGLARGGRCALVLPELTAGAGRSANRDRAVRIAEAEGLALAIGLDVVGHRIVPIRKASAATLLGSGKIKEIADFVTDEAIELVVVDGALSAIQQRNLESALACKVIDRTALILEIFGERAVTAEGRLQVELAHLDYQQGRLVRSWTHLERQRGGFGFLGGPGETQIEADRRMIRDRMARLRRSLADVRRTRALHRARRQRAPWPVIALVGYTNAGKSTLFNRLTESAVVAEDMLFATLDPTLRQLPLPGLGKVIVSDTVGFVSDLPTQLVAAFRATLEEVESADLLLHVRDISHADSEAQRLDVITILEGLGVLNDDGDSDASLGGPNAAPPMIEVWNKLDLLEPADQAAMAALAEQRGAVAVSAQGGAGMSALLERLASALGAHDVARTVTIALNDGARQAWLHRHARIVTQRSDDHDLIYDVTMSHADSARFDRLVQAPAS